MMRVSPILGLLVPVFTPQVVAQNASGVASAMEAEATDMGPAAFMWPPDRVWGASVDNTPPCGSVAGVTTRSQFPLR